MEIWFWAAVVGAVFAGLSNFYFKQAAVRGYNAELFSLYGGLTSVSLVGLVLLFQHESLFGHGWIAWLMFFGGLLASLTNILKITALRFIDSTIYFPLFKLLAPALAIVAGIIFFKESFSVLEWVGMLMGLLVPLLLINRAEDGRQNNLLAGLIIVVITGIFSAAAAVFSKLATNLGVPVVVIVLFVSSGVLVGTVCIMSYRRGVNNIIKIAKAETSLGLIIGSFTRAALIACSMGAMFFAFTSGGTLAVVQTIHSMYILIPIVLAIIFYKEHWNLQKMTAVLLSIAALGLLG